MNKIALCGWLHSKILLMTITSFSLSALSICAQAKSLDPPPQAQEITGSNGDTFMEETAAPAPRRQTPHSPVSIHSGAGAGTRAGAGSQSSQGTGPNARANIITPLQSVTGSGNNVFMQEVDDPANKAKPRKAYVDLSNVGIQVDPSGSLVPVIDRNSNGAVRPLGSSLQVYNEMPVPTINPTYDNPFALPYTMDGQPAAVGTAFVPVTPGTVPFLQPSYNPYNGMTTLNPYSANPNPFGYGGLPYGGYGGYPGYGRPVGINIGKLHIGAQPGFYPGYGGYPGSGYPGRRFPGVGFPGFGNAGYLQPGYPANPLFGYGAYGNPGYGYGGGYGYGAGNGLFGDPSGLPSPLKSTYTSASSSSALTSPVLRDPATSTGDLLEDAKRAGLWSNTAGSGSGYSNRGIFGGSSGGTEEQHQTGDTYGAGLK